MKMLIILLLSVLLPITPSIPLTPEKAITSDVKSEYAYANVKVVKILPSEVFVLDEYLERIILNFRYDLRLDEFLLEKEYKEGKISEENYSDRIRVLINTYNDKIYVINKMRDNYTFAQQFTKLYEVLLVDTNEDEISFRMYYLLDENNGVFGVLTHDMQRGLFGVTPKIFAKRLDIDFFNKNNDFYYSF